MRNFKILQNFLLLLITFFVVDSAMAQSVIEITAPAELAGRRIEYSAAAWTGGPEAWETKVGTSSPASRTEPDSAACVAVTNDLTGTVALIKRGTCSFGTKAYNAQVANAKAVLIVNNADGVISMAADAAFDVTIPTGMITKGIGDTLMALIKAGVPVSVRAIYVCEPAAYSDDFTVIWGLGAGEGMFEGGWNGWENRSFQCAGSPSEGATWRWEKGGLTKGSLHGGNTIKSRTSCNGAMVFDSDFLENGGTDPSTGTCGVVNSAGLESPSIPIPPGLNGVSVRFSQRVAQFQSEFYLGYSTDNGATWDSIQINQDVKPFTAADPNPDNIVDNTRNFKLPNVEDASSVKLRFTINGNYYYWIIDDVMLIVPEDYNIALPLADNWFGGPTMVQNFHTQATTNVWMTDVQNNGALDATNVVLTVSVKDDAGAIIYQYQHEIGDIASGDTVQNIVNQGLTFVTPDLPGEYTIEYRVTMDSADYDNSDNVKTMPWVISNDIYGAGYDYSDAYSLNATAGGTDWLAAAIYRHENKDDFESFDKVRVGFYNQQASLVGLGLEMRVYEYSDDNGDQQISKSEITGGNGVPIAVADITIDSLNAAQIMDVELHDVDTYEPTSVTMKVGKSYIVGIRILNDINTESIFYMVDRSYNSYATEFAQTNLDPDLYRPSNLFQRTDDNKDFNITLERNRLGMPLAEIFMKPTIANKKPILASSTFSVFPTVAKDFVNLEFNLPANTTGTIEIMDIAGKVVYSEKSDTYYNQVKKINFGQVAAGTYIVKLTTGNGIVSKQFTVIK